MLGIYCAIVSIVAVRRLLTTLHRSQRRRVVRSTESESGSGSGSSLRRRLTWRRRAVDIDWAAALDGIATELRTGSSLPGAIDSCTSVEQFQRFSDSGETLMAMLERLNGSPARHDGQYGDRHLAIGTLIAVAIVGGSGGAAIERTAETIRERREALAERKAQSAQARLSAMVLSALPPVFALWSMTTDARVRTFLLGSSLGALCLGGGALLNLSGWWWMRRLTGAAG